MFVGDVLSSLSSVCGSDYFVFTISKSIAHRTVLFVFKRRQGNKIIQGGRDLGRYLVQSDYNLFFI